MNENVLPGRALNETISFSPVKPLYCSLLSHKKLLSTLLDDLTSASSVELMLRTTPSKKAKAQPARGPQDSLQQEKLRRSCRGETKAQTSGAIVMPRVLTTGHKPSNPNQHARRCKTRAASRR